MHQALEYFYKVVKNYKRAILSIISGIVPSKVKGDKRASLYHILIPLFIQYNYSTAYPIYVVTDYKIATYP